MRLHVLGSLLEQALENGGPAARLLLLGEVRQIPPGTEDPPFGIPEHPALAARQLVGIDDGDRFQRLALQLQLALAPRALRHLLRDHQLIGLVVELDGALQRSLKRGSGLLLFARLDGQGSRLLDPRLDGCIALIRLLESFEGRLDQLLRRLLAEELLLADLRLVDGTESHVVDRIVGSQLDGGERRAERLVRVGNDQLELRPAPVDARVVGGQLDGEPDDLGGSLEIAPENQLELVEQGIHPLRIEPLSLPVEEDGVLELTGLAGEVRDLLVDRSAVRLELEGRSQLDGRLLELVRLAVRLRPGHVFLEALLLGGAGED